MRTWTVPAMVVRVVDGDTIAVNLDLGWRVYRNAEHLRIAGIDAPERNTRKGRAAASYARGLLPEGMTVVVVSQARPTFTRTVGSIMLPDGRDFADAMVEAGHAVRVD